MTGALTHSAGFRGVRRPESVKGLDHAARGVHALGKFFQCGLLRALVVIRTRIRARTPCFGPPELGKLGCEHVHRGLGQEIHQLAVTKQTLCQRLRIQYPSSRRMEPYEGERACAAMVYLLQRKWALDRFVAKRRRCA